MSFILYCYIPQLLHFGRLHTNNKRPYIGSSDNTPAGIIIESDNPLSYEIVDDEEVPPYESDADTLGGKPASDYVLDSELTEALANKANSVHNHPASQITAGTLGGQVNANATAVANIGTAQVRDIYAGTSDIGTGAALAAGVIYLVYE